MAVTKPNLFYIVKMRLRYPGNIVDEDGLGNFAWNEL